MPIGGSTIPRQLMQAIATVSFVISPTAARRPNRYPKTDHLPNGDERGIWRLAGIETFDGSRSRTR
jgi:hypothetical protein